MRIDHGTLMDLEILSSAGQASGLLDELDRTRTEEGRRALRRRLTRPLESVEEVRDVQSALRFLAATPVQRLSEAEVVAIRHYLESTFVTLAPTGWARSWVESAWIRLRYRELYRFAVAGEAMVATFLSRMESLAQTLQEAPGVLSRMGEEIHFSLASDPMQRITAARPSRSWRSVLMRDRQARKEGRMEVDRMLNLVHELDALIAMAVVTEELGFCFPEFDDEGLCLEIEGLYHPILEAPVKNAMVLSSNERLVIVTGPNMAGKTTHLKACGIAVLLAHTGMGVPADTCRLSLVQRLISAIQTEDNLREGVSYFQAEARRVREIVDPLAAGERCLVIVDEMFRGTNVKDASDASRAVLRAFACAKGSWFLIATHLVEVAVELSEVPGVVLNHFEAKTDRGAVRFSYELKSGPSAQRLGMEVLRREGVLDALDKILLPRKVQREKGSQSEFSR